MKRLLTVIVCLSLAAGSAYSADTSEFYKNLEVNYATLDQDLLNNPGEVANVKDFVYSKDVATFTFEEGQLFLLRYVLNRPTTALFIGKGKATVNIPSHVERDAMACAMKSDVPLSGTIEEPFEVCFLRFGDDFDLRLKEQFTFEQKQLDWKTFSKIKEAQGEMFFKPTINHEYDNYFQLLRSCYERDADGYFWIDFNRFVFSFDPNRPEETCLSYEFEGGDITLTDGVRMQRQEDGVYDDAKMSYVDYPTTRLSVDGTLTLGGIDGKKLDEGRGTMRLLINADSLRFLSTFVHFNLKVDSAQFNGKPLDMIHRSDFRFVGLILPEYAHRDDTIEVTLFYHGKDFGYGFPYVENPQPAMHRVEFDIRGGFNYLVPGHMGTEATNGTDMFVAAPDKPLRRLYFESYGSGADTVTQTSEIGLTVNVIDLASIDKRYYPACYIPDDIYRSSAMNAVDFLTSKLGPPMGGFLLWIYPEGFMSMPGIVGLPQVACVREGTMEAVGGFNMLAGHAVARQYFGPLLQPVSYREKWLEESMPQYLSAMFLQERVSGSQFYSNLLARRDSIYTLYDRQRQMPIAIGERASDAFVSNMGIWMLHMLRFAFFDVEKQSASGFDKLIHEAYIMFNNKPFSNDDFVKLAERHYGESLDWFFREWLYGSNLPRFKVEYSIQRGSDGTYTVPVSVATDEVQEDFQMPVLMRIEDDRGGSTFHRQTVTAGSTTFELGPFSIKPKQLHFNEFFSVLSKDDVHKK